MRAAILYFLITFAIAFILGAVRTMLIAPRIGGLAAVMLEVPVMILVSWLVAGRVIAHCAVPARMGPRLAMELGAFVLLMAVEITLGVYGFGRPVAQIVQDMLTPAGLIGLGGQIVFAFVPVLRLIRA